jgi:hypothetical protein
VGVSDLGTLGATKLTPFRRTRPRAATATADDIFDLIAIKDPVGQLRTLRLTIQFTQAHQKPIRILWKMMNR